MALGFATVNFIYFAIILIYQQNQMFPTLCLILEWRLLLIYYHVNNIDFYFNLKNSKKAYEE